jgi:hypothetical protein
MSIRNVSTRRAILAASVAAGAISLTPTILRAASEIGSVNPFRIDIPQEALDDLRRRITATRWPDRETLTDQSQGVLRAMLRDVARAWTCYDWRKCEANPTPCV